jgi:acetyl esterase/lipase
MLNKTINFTADGRVNIKTYVLPPSYDNRPCPKRPAIIILPGGAFTFLSEREAEPVALTFAKEGFHTFVLSYSVGDYSAFPNPLDEVSKAIWEVRRCLYCRHVGYAMEHTRPRRQHRRTGIWC